MAMCGISHFTEPTIFFDFDKDEAGNKIYVNDFTKYIIRLESDSFAIQKDNDSPDVSKEIETNSLSIYLTQEETLKFEPDDIIKMQVYYEIDGVPNVTEIIITTARDALDFEGVVL